MIHALDDKRLSELGVLQWGYVENLAPASYQRYLDWVKKGFHGSLQYLSDERKTKRSHLQHIYPEVQSILVFSFGYHSRKKKDLETSQQIASYVTAFDGQDYHTVMQEKLKLIGNELHKELGANFEVAVDTKPILERDFAHQTGLGWFGKNSMLLNRQSGSYFMLGILLLNKKLTISSSSSSVIETDHCGSCRACIDACPTNAILENERSLVAERCISTYTIEHFKDLPAPEGYATTDYIFGCDICQDVCPWNKKSLKNYPAQVSESEITNKLKRNDLVSWLENMSNREFRRIFASTPLERTGRIGLLKNIKNKKTTS